MASMKSQRGKKQNVNISLYEEDIERLDALTANRSDFIRQCISQAWQERQEGRKLSLGQVQRSWLHDLLKVALLSLTEDERANLIDELNEQ